MHACSTSVCLQLARFLRIRYFWGIVAQEMKNLWPPRGPAMTFLALSQHWVTCQIMALCCEAVPAESSWQCMMNVGSCRLRLALRFPLIVMGPSGAKNVWYPLREQ